MRGCCQIHNEPTPAHAQARRRRRMRLWRRASQRLHYLRQRTPVPSRSTISASGTDTLAYTRAMFAALTSRRMGTRLRANEALRKESPVPRVLLVSNYGNFGGGGATVFRDMAVALREKQPDLDLVAVYPWKGSLAKECARHGIRTKIALTPWWAFPERWRTPRIEALIGALPRGALLLLGILQAVLLLVRLRPTMVITNTMLIPSHAVAAKLLGIPHYWYVLEFGRDDHQLRFLFGLPQEHPPDQPAVGVGDLHFTGNREGHARARSNDEDVPGVPGCRYPGRYAVGATAGRAYASCACW